MGFKVRQENGKLAVNFFVSAGEALHLAESLAMLADGTSNLASDSESVLNVERS